MNESLILLDLEGIITEETLLKETERLAHIGSWHTNLKAGISRWSDETYRLLGFQPGEVAPQSERFLKQVHPDDREYLKKKVEEIETKNLSSQNFELRIIDHRTKAIKYIQTKLIIKRDYNGEIVSRSGFNLDVTSMRLAEQALHESEANLRAIFDNTSTVYLLVNKELKIVSFNKAALEEFSKGISKKLKAGENIIDFIVKGNKERFMKLYKKVFEGEHIKLEDSYKLADGSTLWYYMQLIPVFGKNKEVHSMIIYLRNITERKAAEIERDKIISDLMECNKKLTHLLNSQNNRNKEKRLATRKKMLKSATGKDAINI